jgi:short-subunit dehydrogenase
MDFRGKSVIVTGASTGIGRGLSEELAARGARLSLAARDAATLAEVAARCRAVGGEAIAVATDVADPESCRRLVDETVRAFGGVDALVNNAGISMWARFEQVTDLSIYDRLMQVNYLGAVYCTHFALPHLRARGGLLVAVASLTARTAVPTRTGYAASKHAMQGFFDSLRIELRGSGVDVLVVSPGFVATDLRVRSLGADGRPREATEEGRGMMSVEECSRRIARAMERREREVVMTARARFGLWLRLLAPGLLDALAARAVGERPSRAR